jgi:hypothetical protein
MHCTYNIRLTWMEKSAPRGNLYFVDLIFPSMGWALEVARFPRVARISPLVLKGELLKQEALAFCNTNKLRKHRILRTWWGKQKTYKLSSIKYTVLKGSDRKPYFKWTNAVV